MPVSRSQIPTEADTVSEGVGRGKTEAAIRLGWRWEGEIMAAGTLSHFLSPGNITWTLLTLAKVLSTVRQQCLPYGLLIADSD